MNVSEIHQLARTLLDQHGFEHVPIEWTRKRRSWAAAAFDTRTGDPVMLQLSSVVLPRVPDAEVRDTVLHEIAHFETGLEERHGPAWKMAAARLGARPRANTTPAPHILETFAKYRLTCRACGARGYLFRKPTRSPLRYPHGQCDGTFALTQLR